MALPDNNKPFSLILGDELKPFLQEMAQKENRSVGYLIRKILMDYKNNLGAPLIIHSSAKR